MRNRTDFVGMAGFEPATSRPPDEHSNRAEPHPEWAANLQKNRALSSNKRSCFLYLYNPPNNGDPLNVYIQI